MCCWRVALGGFTLYTVSSLQCATACRDNVKDIVSLHRVVWPTYNVALYWCLM